MTKQELIKKLEVIYNESTLGDIPAIITELKEEIKQGEVFTPLNHDKTKRLSFPMSDVVVIDGNLDLRIVGYKATVSIHGVKYFVFGCPCDLGNCNCDAYIMEVTA